MTQSPQQGFPMVPAPRFRHDSHKRDAAFGSPRRRREAQHRVWRHDRRPRRARPHQREAAAGTSVLATLVFEIPNQAIALVLNGPQGARLSLGTGHHTAP
ncbi:hypothetical protein E3T35_18725 [Cryobacterium sp. TMT1-2-2]|nr:hypothetical protein E3T29_07370 [Cryobacterium sp. TMT1-66-1]TFD08028.1 hypothetical protein E3T35_18725 [Cryobacterium sp. TMT1-2-2]